MARGMGPGFGRMSLRRLGGGGGGAAWTPLALADVLQGSAALVLSDDEIRSIGIDAPRLRLLLIACATLAAALTVATAGIIGWIGLVVPHAARLLVGARFSRLLPVAMLIGGLLMLVIDTLARSLAAIEVPPGVLTALIGGPVLFALMARGGGGDEGAAMKGRR